MTGAIRGYDKGMKIGIIGTNSRAVAIGRLLASGGHDISFSDAQNRQAAERAASDIGVAAENAYDQAVRDILVFACARSQIDATLTAIGSGVHCIVLDALDGGPDEPHRGAELLARKLDTHDLVRALIVLPQTGANIPLCGDDPAAKAVVQQAFEACGCITSDRGPLSNAAELEPHLTSIAA